LHFLRRLTVKTFRLNNNKRNFTDDVGEVKLRKNRASLLKMLVLNLYKMGATGDSYIRFTPSKTPLGKNLPNDIDG